MALYPLITKDNRMALNNNVINKTHADKEKFFMDNLHTLANNVVTPIQLKENFLIRRIVMLKDEEKILILRSLIYNQHLKQAFLNQDENLMNIVQQLIQHNTKLNQQMAQPIDASIRSCAGDTLMHCVARMGYRRLLITLFNAGADTSLNKTNRHGFTPFDSVINQIERIKNNPTLTPMEKGPYILDLANIKDTLANLNHRKILNDMRTIREAFDIPENDHEALKNMVTSLPHTFTTEGFIGGTLGILQKIAQWFRKKQKVKDDNTLITDKEVATQSPPFVRLRKNSIKYRRQQNVRGRD